MMEKPEKTEMDEEKLMGAARMFYDACTNYDCSPYHECPISHILGGCEVGRNPTFWNIEGRTV